MPAPQPMNAASTTSQISSARTSARSVSGACSTASPKARRAAMATRVDAVLPACGAAGAPAIVESPGSVGMRDVQRSQRRDRPILEPGAGPINRCHADFVTWCGKFNSLNQGALTARPRSARVASRSSSMKARTTSTTGSCAAKPRVRARIGLEGRRPQCRRSPRCPGPRRARDQRRRARPDPSSACSRCAIVVLIPGGLMLRSRPIAAVSIAAACSSQSTRAPRAAHPGGEVVRNRQFRRQPEQRLADDRGEERARGLVGPPRPDDHGGQPDATTASRKPRREASARISSAAAFCAP